MILHFCPLHPIPPRLSVAPPPAPVPQQPHWAFEVLTNRPALSPASVLCILPGATVAERGNACDGDEQSAPRGVSTASRLFSQVPVNPVSPMN